MPCPVCACMQPVRTCVRTCGHTAKCVHVCACVSTPALVRDVVLLCLWRHVWKGAHGHGRVRARACPQAVIDEGKVSKKTVDGTREYLKLPHFNRDAIWTKSRAAAGLCEWAVNIVKWVSTRLRMWRGSTSPPSVWLDKDVDAAAVKACPPAALARALLPTFLPRNLAYLLNTHASANLHIQVSLVIAYQARRAHTHSRTDAQVL